MPDRLFYPVRLKLLLKVFGKESEEKTFYKRVFLSNACKISMRISFLNTGYICYSLISFLMTGTPKIIPAPIRVKIISGSI